MDRIPTEALPRLLPDKNLSVNELLRFPIPLQSMETPPEGGISAFFNYSDPTVTDITCIQAFPCPPISIIHQLETAMEGMISAGCRSIRGAHVRGRGTSTYPLWVVPYWAEIYNVRKIYQEWARVEAFSRKRKQRSKAHPECAELLTELSDTLSCLPWWGKLQGFGHSDQLHTLATYATDDWFYDTHINQISDLLRMDLTRQGCQAIEIESVFFIEKLRAGYLNPAAYAKDVLFRWPRERGMWMYQGNCKQIGFLVNINQNHWVAVVVDATKCAIWYGDSLGGSISKELEDVLLWWTMFHTKLTFEIRSLPISHQIDGFSCGLFAWNALVVHFIPETELIVTKEVLNERVRVLLRIVRHHQAHTWTYGDERMTDPVDGLNVSPADSDESMVHANEPITIATLSNAPSDIQRSQDSAKVPQTSPSSLIPASWSSDEADNSGSCWEPGDRTTEDSSDSESQLSDDIYWSEGNVEELNGFLHADEDRDDEDRARDNIQRTQSHSSMAMHMQKRVDNRSSPGASPSSKKSKKSAIRVARELAEEQGRPQTGLLRFFKTCTRDEYTAQMAKVSDEVKELNEAANELAEKAQIQKREREKELSRLRKRRSRKRKVDSEIATGERSPGGTKKRKTDATRALLPDCESNWGMSALAEVSRPARDIRKRFKDKTRKPQGRPLTQTKRPRTYINWHNPILWRQIEDAAKAVGWTMSPTDIVNLLRKRNTVFNKLSRETVRNWIDQSDGHPRWKPQVLVKANQGSDPGHSNGGQRGALSRHPNVSAVIRERLTAIRDASAPLTVVTIRGIMVATIAYMAPEILQKTFSDGSTFRASDSFVRNWVKKELNWTQRKATRAAQKLPDNWEDECEKSFFRKVHLIKKYDIPSALYVNSDQTQIVYAPGDKMTYAPIGAKQVSLVGGDEKRAFTLMVSVTSNGKLLGFQAIYEGKSTRSCPSSDAPRYNDLIELDALLEFSGTDTYWSNPMTMHSFVNKILAPYFDRTKVELNLPAQHHSLWQIDVWSVHRSKDFRGWMHKYHPTIILDFVPGGCTSVGQPCDVGIQRPLKHSIKRSYHEDIVNEMFKKLCENEALTVDRKVGQLRDRSVGWLYNAHIAINKPDLVKKAFEMCRVRDWNLSYECLTSFAARTKLNDMEEENETWWKEITAKPTKHGNLPAVDHIVQEDKVEDDEDDDYLDDSDLRMDTVILSVVTESAPAGTSQRSSGGLKSSRDAESDDKEPIHGDGKGDPESVPEELENEGGLGRGKRRRRANQLYSTAAFVRHNDGEASDAE